jgi:hypothetical protein
MRGADARGMCATVKAACAGAQDAPNDFIHAFLLSVMDARVRLAYRALLTSRITESLFGVK